MPLLRALSAGDGAEVSDGSRPDASSAVGTVGAGGSSPTADGSVDAGGGGRGKSGSKGGHSRILLAQMGATGASGNAGSRGGTAASAGAAGAAAALSSPATAEATAMWAAREQLRSDAAGALVNLTTLGKWFDCSRRAVARSVLLPLSVSWSS